MRQYITILDLNDFSILMQTIGLAVVTILIPFAVAIIINILQNKNLPNNDFVDLDMHVALDHLFRFRKLPIYLGLIFLPPLFWGASINVVRVIIIIGWSIGIALMFIMLFDLYNWIKGNQKDFRFSYLKKLETPNDMKVVWESVWSAKNINYPNDRKYFEIFSNKIDKRIRKCDLETIYNLLSTFAYNIKSRIPVTLTFRDGIFQKLLEWHYIFWKKEQISLEKENGIKIPDYGDILYDEIDPVLVDIHQIFLHRKRSSFYFKNLTKHADSIVDDLYLKDLFQNFFSIIFELDADSITSDIWYDSFPKSWKITEQNISNNKNVIPKLAFQNFIKWAAERIINANEKYDKKLDLVARELFPDVNAADWAIILMIAFTHGKSMVSIIKRNWNFGLITVLDKAEESTFKLAFLLFDKVFSKENLEKYKTELKSLKYEKDSIHESQKRDMKRIIKKMLQMKK